MYPDLSGLALVFDYMPHTLYSRLKDEENPLSRQQIQSYTQMLLRGLSYLHDDLKIMHRVKNGFVYWDLLTLIFFLFDLLGHKACKSVNQWTRRFKDCWLWTCKVVQPGGDTEVLLSSSCNSVVSSTRNFVGNSNLWTFHRHVGCWLRFCWDASRSSIIRGNFNDCNVGV